ncbi:dethiobiotin synthase [Zobellia galactanivorans]|uniref:dethiobiotin synthase n=1 Tax=Zobellia galactanivorans (strain DSM 12802 / CCUG 47099 / CIP 106680 / NCIMB 13871 / Dsij) TaxID=63186 RepID=UPI001C06C94F|nr:dethiobiotin synthase [Zobellia galactanivorans]MBU3028086.1 dethiobiotin synthase [Zobellia galactanivorans]MDO6808367.1 dethiobiotin synthase [Zobellia galactanivorans]
MQQIFVTGISTEVGKTIASAIIAEALEADYWKPVQAGELDYTDSDKVKSLVSNDKTVIHKSSYELKTPMSPHAAAEKEGVSIDRLDIVLPETDNALVIEGAGGILVPLNENDTVLDIIMPTYHVVVVSRHYLGSINHTLLTVGWLQQKGYDVSILFSGDANPESENIILHKTGASLIGRIDEEPVFDKAVVKRYADKFASILKTL